MEFFEICGLLLNDGLFLLLIQNSVKISHGEKAFPNYEIIMRYTYTGMIIFLHQKN